MNINPFVVKNLLASTVLVGASFAGGAYVESQGYLDSTYEAMGMTGTPVVSIEETEAPKKAD